MADVQDQRDNNGGQVGGITGKGWTPGVSGNPAGRPRGLSLTSAARALLNETARDRDGNPIPGKTWRDVIAAVLVELAAGGDLKAIHYLHDWTEGRVRQSPPEQTDNTVRDAAIARLRAIHDHGPTAPDSGA